MKMRLTRKATRKARESIKRVRLTSWYLMGNKTKRPGFSWRIGSIASSSLIVGATVGLASSRSSSKSSGIPTMGLKVFSFSAGEKSNFFAGESFILSESMADEIYLTR